RATQFVPADGYTALELGRLASLASVADQTPEGKSILDLYQRVAQLPAAGTTSLLEAGIPADARFVEFTAQTRMSGVDLPDGRSIRKGAVDAVLRHLQAGNGAPPAQIRQQADAVASQGATPLLVCEGNRLAGMVVLEDILKPGIRERFERLRKMGLRT